MKNYQEIKEILVNIQKSVNEIKRLLKADWREFLDIRKFDNEMAIAEADLEEERRQERAFEESLKK